MSLLTDLDAFYLEHKRCGDIDGSVSGEGNLILVWISCSCGGRLNRRVIAEEIA